MAALLLLLSAALMRSSASVEWHAVGRPGDVFVDAEPGQAEGSAVQLTLCGRSLVAGYIVGGRIFAALHTSGRAHDSWRPLAGGHPVCDGGAASMALATRDPDIFVGYVDTQAGGRATVKTATTEGWHTIGQAGFSAEASHLTLAVDSNGTPFVAYAAIAHAGRVSVLTFEAASGRWIAVGGLTVGSELKNAASVQLTLVSHVPIVAFIGEDDLGLRKLSVLRFEGDTSWKELAPSGASSVAKLVSVSMLATPLHPEILHATEHDDDDDDEDKHRPLSLIIAVNQDGPGGACVWELELDERGAPLSTHWRDAIGPALRAAVGNAQFQVVGMAAHKHGGSSLHVAVLHIDVLQLEIYALSWQKAGPPVFKPVGGTFQLGKLPTGPGLLSLTVENHEQPVIASVNHALENVQSPHHLSVLVHHQQPRIHPHALKPAAGGHYLDSEVVLAVHGDDSDDDDWDWDNEDDEEDETPGSRTQAMARGLGYAHPFIAAGLLATALLVLKWRRSRRGDRRYKRSSGPGNGNGSDDDHVVLSISTLTPRQGSAADTLSLEE
ncbi:hypothetical protein T492DRAFT_856541 [Pavlovales sp. CCMP2436]|nr:hypothetical protein T492DRAFT_856541 [Pavlovales sp. CCMP2436]